MDSFDLYLGFIMDLPSNCWTWPWPEDWLGLPLDLPHLCQLAWWSAVLAEFGPGLWICTTCFTQVLRDGPLCTMVTPLALF